MGSKPKTTFGSKTDYNKDLKDVKGPADKYGFNFDPNSIIEDISVRHQQKVEI
ncbi:hypothetical protein TCEA9_00020 [Thermobrachium celere]|nr:hypothetical protein TCEA9_00020 [Thermobrachium celere]